MTIPDGIVYGAISTVVLGMGGFVIYIIQGNRKDRKDHKEEKDKMFKTLVDLHTDSQKNIKDNTDVLSGLKTLLRVHLKDL